MEGIVLFILLGVCAFGLGFVLGLGSGEIQGKRLANKEAVKANVAEYYLDSNYEKQFRYKEVKCQI